MQSLFRPIGLVACVVTMLVACSRTTDEQAIRQALDDMTQAIEMKEPARLLDYVAMNFRGPESMGRGDVRRMMAYQFTRNENIKLFMTGLSIEVKGQQAHARFHATLTGALGLLPERLQYYAVDLEWWKDKKQWSVISADWQPVFGDQ